MLVELRTAHTKLAEHSPLARESQESLLQASNRILPDCVCRIVVEAVHTSAMHANAVAF